MDPFFSTFEKCAFVEYDNDSDTKNAYSASFRLGQSHTRKKRPSMSSDRDIVVIFFIN